VPVPVVAASVLTISTPFVAAMEMNTPTLVRPVVPTFHLPRENVGKLIVVSVLPSTVPSVDLMEGHIPIPVSQIVQKLLIKLADVVPVDVYALLSTIQYVVLTEPPIPTPAELNAQDSLPNRDAVDETSYPTSFYPIL